MIHKSVLLNEIVSSLSLPEGALVVDGTLGAGGHSKEICKKFPGVRVVGIDQDARAIREAEQTFKGLNCEAKFFEGNFRNIEKILDGEKADAVILDLGFSSDQIESSGRGFSFMRDEPLLMTMKENPFSGDLTAEVIVNDWGEESLEKIIFGYGEEKYAKRIARKIVEARGGKRIATTLELAKIIEDAVGRRGRIPARPNGRSGRHPATKTFQALRIAVNDELKALEEGLESGFRVLKAGGAILVISFHSLEDRIVKNFYKKQKKENKAQIINKKPITASVEEIKANPRARSAKLRILKKL